MGEWKESKLGNELELLYGKGLKESDRVQGNIPVYGSNGIVGYHNKFLVNGPGIIIGRKGSVGEVKYTERDFFPIDTTYYVRLKNDNDIKFFYYFLSTLQLNEMNSHSAVPGLNRTDVYSIEIIIPDSKEQRAIASILTSLDDKIDLLHRQNKTLEQLAETLFRQWFVEEAAESWEEKSLDEIAEYLNGLALQKFPSRGFDDLPVIKIREMRQGISENTDRCRREIPQQYIIQDGDILFSWSGSLEVVIWSGGEGALNQHLFKVSSDNYPKWFYYLATKSHLPTFRSIAESKTTTMGHIQREHLKQATVLIPPKELFDNYNKTIEPIIEKVIKNNFQIRTLTQLRDTLLPKLMSGEVRVKI